MKDTMEITVESPAFPPGDAYLIQLEGREAISQLFRFSCQVASATPAGLDTDALLTSPVSLVFTLGGVEQRRIHGLVSKVTEVFTASKARRVYRFDLVPRLFRGSLNNKIDIYMDQTIPEIVAFKLKGLGLVAGEDFEMRLGAYPKREFVVQYRESDVEFINRITEHLGIAYYFEHDTGRDKIVFGDENARFRPIEGESSNVELHERDVDRGVHALETTTSTVVGRYLVRDYNYRTPQQDLTAIQGVTTGGAGDIVEYGAHFKTSDEGAEFARVRAEEILAGRKVHVGQGTESRLRAGSTFVLEGHPSGDLKLLVTEVRHRSEQSADGAVKSTANRYENEFRAIDSETTYRPPRITPKPKVAGVLTGIIDAAAKGQYAELDAEGRYKVKFLCDTAETPGGQASRPVRMAQPHAGQGYGMHFPLRPGIEVVVTCVDGDPDRPIIAGTVPNPSTPTPVTAGNAPRNVIRTGGGNEINIDDTEGNQRIKLTTPRKGTVFQLGSPNFSEDGAALATEGAYTSAITGATSAVTGANSMLTEINTLMSSGDIVTEADVLGKLAKFTSVLNMISGAADVAGAVMTLAQADATINQVETSNAADRASAAADKVAADLTEAEKEAQAAYEDAERRKKNAEWKVEQKNSELKAAREERAKIDQQPLLPDEEADARLARLAPDYQAVDAKIKEAETAIAAGEKEVDAAKVEVNAKDQARPKDKKKKLDDANAEKESAAKAKQLMDDSVASSGWKAAQTHLAAGVAGLNAFKAAVAGAKLVSDIIKLLRQAQEAKAIFRLVTTRAASHAVGSVARTQPSASVPTPLVHVLSSSMSTMLEGKTHAIVRGGDHVTVHGGDTVLVTAKKNVVTSALMTAEMNGELKAVISSRELVDVYSKDSMRIVAHSQEQSQKEADSLLLVAQKGMRAQSTDESIVIEAKKGITIDAQTTPEAANEGDIYVSAGKTIFCRSQAFAVRVNGEHKKIEVGKFGNEGADADHGALFDEAKIAIKNDTLTLHGKKAASLTGGTVLITSEEGDVVTEAKGRYRVKSKHEIKFEASEALTMEGKKLCFG